MSAIRIVTVVLATACVVGVGMSNVVSAGRPQASNIQGAWEVTDVVSPGAGGGPVTTHEPGVFIFSAGHYSAVFVASPRPRIQAAELDTPDAFRAVWGGPFTAQAGQYSVVGANQLLLKPTVAKNPTNMGSGVEVRWRFDLKANVLSITEPSGRVVRMRRAE